LSYDGEKHIWEFRVDHFTKWGDEDSDEEMTDEKPTVEERRPIGGSELDDVSEVAAEKSMLGDSISDSLMSE
jgi:hypothetical protein